MKLKETLKTNGKRGQRKISFITYKQQTFLLHEELIPISKDKESNPRNK